MLLAFLFGLAVNYVHVDVRPVVHVRTLRPHERRVLAVAAALTIPASFILYANAFASAIAEVRPFAVERGLPVAIFGIAPYETALPLRGLELLALTVVAGLALVGYVVTMDALDRRVRRSITVAIVATLGIAAVAAHGAHSSDVYFYVGLATLGMHAYQPPAVALPGDLAAVSRLWGVPLLPSAYGPLWIALSALIVAPLGSLAAKVTAFRILGFASIVACGLLARALGSSRAVVVAIVCNPAFYDLYVMNAHNDLLGVDVVLGAMVCVKRGWHVAGIVLAIAATFIKFTLLPAAFACAAYERSFARRIRGAALVTVVPAAVYLFADGGVFPRAFAIVSKRGSYPVPAIETLLHLALVAAALAAIGGAILYGRVRARAGWSFPALAAPVHLWYLGWGLPFALTDDAVALPFLLTLPIPLFLLSPLYGDAWPFAALRFALAFGAIALITMRSHGTRAKALLGRG
jgi:hypothetical protein